MTKNDSDSAWKELLDYYLKDCIDYCLPDVSVLIDWKKGWVSLDKELQVITKSTAASRCLVDKLFRVYLETGEEQWLLLHLEVQGEKEEEFPKRMFTYGYRIYDKYQRPVLSCAILTDSNKDWRPTNYKIGLAGSYLSSEFLIVKLIDFKSKTSDLEISNNPFASVILIQLSVIKNK